MLETELDVLDEEQQDEIETQDVDEPSKADETKSDEWDKERQKQDFERANSRYQRAEAELATMTEAYEQANTKLAELNQKVEELTAAKQNEQDKLDEMDPNIVDEKVASNIRRLEGLLRETRQDLKEARDDIALYKQQKAEADAVRRNEEARESVLSTVEDTLTQAGITGAAKYRNAAIKLADELVDSGEEKQPSKTKNPFSSAVKLLTKCYLQAVKEKTKEKSKTVSVDTGKGGARPPGGRKETGIKEGSLKDVAAQMLKDDSWLND